MNRKYYFISSHGSESGYVYFSPNSYYKANSFPYMGNVEIALFAICYGGKEGNAADVVAHHKGVEYGIGWPGLTYVLSSRTFTNRFWKLIIKDNLDIEEAISKSKKHTQRTYFYNFGIWGDNTIMDPRIYSENSNLNTRSSNNFIENILDKEMIFEDDNHFIHFKKYGDVYTNNFKIVDKNNIMIKDYNKLIHNKSEKYLLTNTNNLAYSIINNNFLNTYIMKKFPNNYLYELILEQNYLLTNTKGEFVKIKRMQIKINDNILDEIYYDETNMKIIEEEEMQNYFDYNKFL